MVFFQGEVGLPGPPGLDGEKVKICVIKLNYTMTQKKKNKSSYFQNVLKYSCVNGLHTGAT